MRPLALVLFLLIQIASAHSAPLTPNERIEYLSAIQKEADWVGKKLSNSSACGTLLTGFLKRTFDTISLGPVIRVAEILDGSEQSRYRSPIDKRNNLKKYASLLNKMRSDVINGLGSAESYKDFMKTKDEIRRYL